MPQVRRATLVEREHELETLDALIADATEGDGRLALIDGLAGVGKTQLLSEARERAQDTMTVLTARASELEREFPFGVVRQLFEAVVADPDQRSLVLGGAADGALGVFEGSADGHESGSFSALHGLYWLVLNLAEQRPLLLAIDDLQWCDRQSLRFVGYLARRVEGERVLIVTTQRSSDPGTDPGLLAEIGQDPLTIAVRPRPLSIDGVRALVRERLGDDADEPFCDACHESTGGNPLLLRQLLTALDADGVVPTASNASVVGAIGPRAVSRTVLPRLARLPPETQAVARAAAVLGESASLQALSALAGVGEARVARATGELARAEILRPEPPMGFVHPLVRDAVYEELSPGERELQHGRAAQLLREVGASDDQVAVQLRNVPPRGEAWVAELLHRAGVAARRRGAADSAVAYLSRALAEPPPDHLRASVLLDLGFAEAMTNAPIAIERLEQAYAAVDDPEAKASVAVELGRLLCFSATPQRGIDIARDAIAQLPADAIDSRFRLTAIQHMAVFFGAGDLDVMIELERYRDGIDAPGAGARMVEAMSAYAWMLQGGPADRCGELSLRALAGSELLDADDTFFTIAAMGPLMAADREEAITMWDTITAAAHRRGSMFSALSVQVWLGFTLLRRGDLIEAERRLRQAIQINESWGVVGGPGLAYTYGMLAEVLVEKGDYDRAQASLAEGPPTLTMTDGENHLRRARTELALARGDDQAALESAEDFSRNAYVENPAWSNWRSLRALAYARVGRRDDALHDAREELDRARQFGAPRALGRALRVLGLVTGGDDGLQYLAEAVTVLDGSPAKLEHARALDALGTALRLARRPTDAREPLRQALDLATVCGAEALAEHARAELHATGARPRVGALQGVGALTPSELRVARLAADGESNKAIAQSLFVTPKTVEVHLSNVYRKLGIRSRRELPGALAEG